MNETFYHIFSTEFGYGAVLFRDQPVGLLEILLPTPDQERLKRKLSGRSREVQNPGPEILRFVQTIREALSGKPVNLSFTEFNLETHTSLQKKVLQTVFEIPPGQTRSYGDIAKAVGKPKAARFVGTTMAKNPFPLLIPCHRVIKSDGTPGQYGGGTDLKVKLLEYEAALKAGIQDHPIAHRP
jgi:methylated-DNA-[protein]-cysteine S-methyltransferase